MHDPKIDGGWRQLAANEDQERGTLTRKGPRTGCLKKLQANQLADSMAASRDASRKNKGDNDRGVLVRWKKAGASLSHAHIPQGRETERERTV